MYLLNRLKDYNEWGQTIILDFVYRYTPKNEKELFDTMNLLEDRLRHSSTALVLATIKIFMKYTKEKEKIFSQVVERIKSPMLTLMSSSDMASTPETTYVILEHIKYIIKVLNAKSVFESDFKYFYFKVDEPTYIKLIKLEILTILAS
jgi:AP-4 complex subunit beta-1